MHLPAALHSASCAFCDAALVDSDTQLSPPDRVLPFAITEERAVRALREHLQGHWLAPEALRRAARPDELRPVLVPFVAFDGLARTQYRCSVGLLYRATVGKGKEKHTEMKTEWFSFEASHGKSWSAQLVSVSRGLPEDEANALEPFDLGHSLPYVPALVAGVASEHATVPHDEAAATARAEISQRERALIAHHHIPGDRLKMLETQSDVQLSEVKTLLLPVWVGAVQVDQGTLRLLVNGQTGAVVCPVPRSNTKVIGLVLSAALSALLFLAVVLVCTGGKGLFG